MADSISTIAAALSPADNTVKIILSLADGDEVIASDVITDFSLSGGAKSNPLSEIGLLKSIRNFSRNLDAADEYSKANNSAFKGLFDSINKAKQSLGFPAASDSIIGGKVFTREHWEGSDKPGFSLTMQMWADSIDESNSMMEKCKLIVTAPYPEKVGGTVSTPPWYFANRGQGNISVSIGKWFYADNLILTSATVDFSKEIIQTGYPVYATIGAKFVSNYQLSATDFGNWFTLNSNAVDIAALNQSDILNTKKTFQY